MDYLQSLKKSWELVKNNLSVFLPIVVGIAFGIVFAIIIGVEVVIFFAMFGRALLTDPASILQSGSAIVFFVFFMLLDVFIGFLISAYIRAMQIGMYGELVEKGKVSSESMFKSGKRFFGRYIEYMLIRSLIFLGPIIVFAPVAYLSFQATLGLGIGVTILVCLLYFVYFVYMALGLFFIEPTIVFTNENIFSQIKSSFAYFKNNLGHTLLTFLCIFGLNLVIGIFFAMVSLPFELMSELSIPSLAIFSGMIGFVIRFIQGIVQAVARTVSDVFIFVAYKD